MPAAVYRRGDGWRGLPNTVGGLAGAADLDALALTSDGHSYAGLRSARTGMRLMIGQLGESPHRVLTADALSAPAFGPGGELYTIATDSGRRRAVRIGTDGVPHRIGVDASLLTRPVQHMKLSRDGARVAAVVGAVGHGRLLIGRVSDTRDGVRLDDFRTVLRGFPDIRGLAWNGADNLVVTAADVGGGRELVALDVDGYGTRTVSTAGLPSQPVEVAAAPGRPMVVHTATGIWVDAPATGWHRVGSGREPTYAD
jgi:hypothetical protein